MDDQHSTPKLQSVVNPPATDADAAAESSQDEPPAASGRTRVAILVIDPQSPVHGRADEQFDYAGAEESDRAFCAALEDAGYEVTWVPVHLGNLDQVVGNLDCDVVFNLCDGSGPGRDNYPGVEAIEAIERRGLPYTGARAPFYRSTISKLTMKELFHQAGVPVPKWQLFSSVDEPLSEGLRGHRLIVKPADAGGSAGVHLDSIVDDEEGLRKRLDIVITDYGHALVEEYIRGREITVGLYGSGEKCHALPPLEVRFGSIFPDDRGIRTHELKWGVGSEYYGQSELLCPAPMTPAQTRTVLRVARKAYKAVMGSGYGRVDMRMDARGPHVLEVNANCSLEYADNPEDTAMYPYAALRGGMPFSELLRALVLDGQRIWNSERAVVSRRRRR